MENERPAGGLVEARRAPLVVIDANEWLIDTARFEQLQRLAALMASCETLPPFLRGKLGDCFRVASQAMRWNLDVWSVAEKCFLVGGRLAFEGQLIAAVVNTRAGLKNRLDYRYRGDPAQPKTLIADVVGTFRGEEKERVVPVSWESGFAISKGAKDQWLRQPEQQLSYYGARVWARRNCPDIILGAYTPDEWEAGVAVDPGTMVDVTPKATVLERFEEKQAKRKRKPDSSIAPMPDDSEEELAAEPAPL